VNIRNLEGDAAEKLSELAQREHRDFRDLARHYLILKVLEEYAKHFPSKAVAEVA